jgi:DNA invertase Pin-like site-specific DNA recombinase
MTVRIRCAIYTRKSTEEGLEQEFNSLDAQREACTAFIQSQRGVGWKALTTRYDDGGISGGSMERPALKALLADTEAGKIDLVVVYKVDRLTRSLADFAKIVELFETRGVSFVSVTQQFNTSTSMGRLTLNVLLSFAQFEREVTGERIRDKIAASKKRGIWMGGQVPLGYEVREKKLLILPQEAETVRSIFQLYLELGSVRAVCDEINNRGIRTKQRKMTDGRITGGKLLTRGHLYYLLTNPLYVGDIAHKEHRYPGQHNAIIEREAFDAVQRQLRNNAAERRSPTNIVNGHLLTGLVFDDTGDRLCPSHANKKGKRYQYYISKRLMHGTAEPGDGWRLPAGELHRAVVNGLKEFFMDSSRLVDLLRLTDASPAMLHLTLSAAKKIANGLSEHQPLKAFVQKITVTPNDLTIDLTPQAVAQLRHGSAQERVDVNHPSVTVSIPVQLQRRGVETRLVLYSNRNQYRKPDMYLVTAIAQAHTWWQNLVLGRAKSVSALAAESNIDGSDVTRILPLAFLAPDIVEAILAGKQPMALTAMKLKRSGNIPLSWHDQRRKLGFTGP